MDYTEINKLTIKEKAQLARDLTADVVSYMQTESFAKQSQNNQRLAGLMRTLGNQYVSHAESLNRQVAHADLPNNSQL